MSDGVTPLTGSQLATQEAQAAKEGIVKRELIGLDMEANDLLGGMPDETISSRCARDAAKGYKVGIWISKVLDWFQGDHGPKAQAGDVERAQAVIAVEKASGNLPK